MTSLRGFLVPCIAAIVLASGPGLRAQPSTDLDQGWSPAERKSWYDATQGSRLIPLSWLEALEQPGAAEPFLADEHIRQFRYLPRPGALPVGFAVDVTDDTDLSVTKLSWKSGQGSTEPWVGMNCSACHTGEITHGQETFRIDGGPTLADFQGFLEALNAALIETSEDAEKFGRFASAVLGTDDDEFNRPSLKGALEQLIAFQLKSAKMNATELRYGFGRLDAFGHIYNKVALVVDPPELTPNPSDAPVSYPFLWNVPQQDRVQYNGIAPRKVLPALPISQPFDVGALARNTGEVIGVFADVKPIPNAGFSGYPSSVQVASLVSMEQLLSNLRPPKWPEAFNDAADSEERDLLVEKGAELFETGCRDCHEVLDRTDLSTEITVEMSLFRDTKPPGTDPWMACNAYTRTAATGVLRGVRREYVKGDRHGEESPLADMLATVVGGILVKEKGEVLESITASFFGRQPPPVVVVPQVETGLGIPMAALTDKERQLERCMREESGILGYKARPLTGIWATAPYLHNGSVPTLYDLLLPPDQRPATFWLGSREFDPVKVGYVAEEGPDNTFPFRTRDTSGRVIDGNSNAGHDYGNAQLTEDDRQALLEYLKTL